MEKPTKVKVGVSRGIYKLERHARLSRYHFEAKIEAYHADEMVRRVPSGRIRNASRAASDREISAPESGSPRSLLPPSEPGLASLHGSLSLGLEEEHQVPDIEGLIADDADDLTSESDFSP
jgi:hypothetical protein